MGPEQEVAVWMRLRLREGLTHALKRRDAEAVAALRSAIAAIDNAEAPAVEPSPATERSSQPIAGAAAGAGSTEAPPRLLTRAEVRSLLQEQVADCRRTAATYARAGRPQPAAQLQRQADALTPYLALLD